MGGGTKDDIVIIGAGPTGLMMACCLRLWGIPARIIDPKPGPLPATRALGVHARTLEAFRQLGIADEAVSRGQIGSHVHFYVDGKQVQDVPIGRIGQGLSAFPYILFLDQPITEQLLIDKLHDLGGSVDWHHKAVAVNGDEVAIERPGGVTEYIAPRYIIGADGSNSVTRQGAGIPLRGNTRDQLFFVADLKVDGDIASDAISVFLCDAGFSAFFPKTGANLWRLVGVTPEGYQPNQDEIQFDEMRDLTMGLLQRDLDLGTPEWISTYRVHHRAADQFSKDSVFLAGDAAHVHSPIGAQGMNTGLLDAHNLAWKLAMVLKGKAGETLLASYDAERRPFAEQLINTTDQAFIAVTSQTATAKFVRRHIVPRIFKYALRLPVLRQFAFRTASQIGIRYSGSPLNGPRVIRKTMRPAMETPSPGDRFPAVQVRNLATDEENDALAFVAYDGFTLLNFGDVVESNLPVQQIQLQAIDKNDQNKLKGRSYLVRPDLVVALSMKGVDEGALRDWFDGISP